MLLHIPDVSCSHEFENHHEAARSKSTDNNSKLCTMKVKTSNQ